MSLVIVDTGPIVSLLNRRDQHHDWTREVFEALKPPLSTCEPVLTEACFLLQRLPSGAEAVFELVDRGVIELHFTLSEERKAVRRLMSKYENVPMSLADACLVRMAEQHPRSKILTLDQDFLIYRKQGRQCTPVLMPT